MVRVMVEGKGEMRRHSNKTEGQKLHYVVKNPVWTYDCSLVKPNLTLIVLASWSELKAT